MLSIEVEKILDITSRNVNFMSSQHVCLGSGPQVAKRIFLSLEVCVSGPKLQEYRIEEVKLFNKVDSWW